MPQPAETLVADGGLDPGGLRTLLEACRLDLGSLKEDARHVDDSRADLAVRAGHSKLEQRLCQVVERLEHTADTLDSVLDRVAGRPAATAAAEVLAREADHRIKNSLQTVVALLEQQARRAEAGAVRDALRLAGGRVEAVAQVHATLHAAPGPYGILPELGLDQYLGGLCAALGRAMDVDGQRRSLHVEVEPLAVSPAAAQQLGLVVTELVTNALRHAFLPDRPGTVRVTGARQRDGSYRLCVADDGKGLPHGFDRRLRPSGLGLGLRLVNVLADQLRARLSVEGHAGARFTLVLPVSVTGFEGGGN
jgi:two-component sensor histidine kinase